MMTHYRVSNRCQIDFDHKDVLEVGCGYGEFTLEYVCKAKSILGIDTNPEAIETLRREWLAHHGKGSFQFLASSIVEIHLEDKSFDAVVFSHSF